MTILIVSALLAEAPGTAPQGAAPKAPRQFRKDGGTSSTEVIKAEEPVSLVRISVTATRWHGDRLLAPADDSWNDIKVFRADDEVSAWTSTQMAGAELTL